MFNCTCPLHHKENLLCAKKINLPIFIKSIYAKKIYKEEIRLKTDSRHHLVRIISCQYMLNSISIPLMQCSLLKWTASQICIFAFSYLSLVLMDLLLLKDTNFCQLWESSLTWEKKKEGKVEGIKCLSLKTAVRTNQQEQYTGCLWPSWWQSLTATSLLTDGLLGPFSMGGRHFSRAISGGAGAEVLSAAFKSILGHEGLVLFEPRDEVPPQTQAHLCVTSSAPGAPVSRNLSIPSLTASLAGSAPPLPKQSCPHFSSSPPCTCPAPATCASNFLFLTPSGCLKCLCPRDKIQCTLHSQGAAVVKFCRSNKIQRVQDSKRKRIECVDWLKWVILASLSSHIFTFLNFLPPPQMFCYI